MSGAAPRILEGKKMKRDFPWVIVGIIALLVFCWLVQKCGEPTTTAVTEPTSTFTSGEAVVREKFCLHYGLKRNVQVSEGEGIPENFMTLRGVFENISEVEVRSSEGTTAQAVLRVQFEGKVYELRPPFGWDWKLTWKKTSKGGG